MNFRISRKTAALVQPMATDLRSVRRRAWFVASVLGLALLGLMYRAYSVAVVNHDFYAEQGNASSCARTRCGRAVATSSIAGTSRSR
jgi:cell division protein FtsI/penicillin-binding protein 2